MEVLLIGKGPSAVSSKVLHKIREFSKAKKRIVGINQAGLFGISAYNLDFYCAFRDFEVWCSFPEYFKTNPSVKFLCPEVLRLEEKPWKPVSEIAAFDRCLAWNCKRKKILSRPMLDNPPCYSTAELVARTFFKEWGVKKVVSLGIDGGIGQSPEFASCYRSNPEASYDIKFDQLKNTLESLNMEWARV